jgi:hypothetical protein
VSEDAVPRAGRGVAALAALLALAPFLRTLALGESFFFRDITRTFFPVRRYVAEGLRQGEWRFWNPLVHEGVPLHLGPLTYPVDLLQALWADERFFTLLLALHVALGAAALALLARRLGAAAPACVAGGVVYALGGFSLSSVNLYVYAQAMAWAPFVALGLIEAAERGGRAIAIAALPVWLCAATNGVEVFGQAVVVGLVLAAARDGGVRRLLRATAALAIGLCLGAPSLVPSWAQIGGSARAAGLPAAVVVAHSIDPWTLPQVLIGDWHGDLLDVANRWWGQNFFPLGFPYFVSLYLGAAAVALALVGAASGRARSRRLALMAAAFLFLSMGRFVGLEPVVEALPFLRVLRFPVKAFYGVHYAAALLAAFGVDALCRSTAAWKRLAGAAGLLGMALVALKTVPMLLPGVWSWFLSGFMPPGQDAAIRALDGALLLADAARGGLLALLLLPCAWLARRGRLSPGRAAWLATALVCADLLRAGAGLNPSVSAAFFRLSPEMAAAIQPVKAEGSRVFSCDPESSPSYFRARSVVAQHDAWSFAVSMETLTPNLNVGFGVKTALSRDLTMMVPEERVLLPEETAPGAVPRHLDRLRAAAVSRVLCVDPIDAPGLREVATLFPRRIAPLGVHVYALDGALPPRSIEGGRIVSASETANRVDLDVETQAPGRVTVRDAVAPGWTARVGGAPAPIVTVEGRYRGVDVPAGRSRVSLSYRPPGLALGLAIAAAGLALLALLLLRD